MKSTLQGQLNRGSYSRRVVNRINQVLNECNFIEGPEVWELEKKMAEFTNRQFAIATSSGTDALILALRELCNKGERVAVPAFSFVASASAVYLTGGEIVFVDVDPDTFTIDVSKIPEDVKVVVAVDMFGIPADYESLKEYTVISDAAQSMGSKLNGIPCGSFGDIACTSFYPTKSLGAYGDAGMVFTNNKFQDETIRRLKNHGEAGKYIHYDIGYNARMDTIQAAVLLEKLNEFAFELEIRQAINSQYRRRLKGVQFQRIPVGANPNYSYFPILLESEDVRDNLYFALKESSVHYPIPLHLQECFKPMMHRKGDFPVAEDICDRILCLPIGAYVSLERSNRIIRKVNKR